jgi:hypothetical protein
LIWNSLANLSERVHRSIVFGACRRWRLVSWVTYRHGDFPKFSCSVVFAICERRGFGVPQTASRGVASTWKLLAEFELSTHLSDNPMTVIAYVDLGSNLCTGTYGRPVRRRLLVDTYHTVARSIV